MSYLQKGNALIAPQLLVPDPYWADLNSQPYIPFDPIVDDLLNRPEYSKTVRFDPMIMTDSMHLGHSELYWEHEKRMTHNSFSSEGADYGLIDRSSPELDGLVHSPDSRYGGHASETEFDTSSLALSVLKAEK